MNLLMLTNILFTLIRGVWILEPNFAESMRPLIQQFRDTRNFDMKHMAAASAEKLQSTLRLDVALVGPTYNANTGILGFSDKCEPGSIAVIPLQGAVMKEDFCGALGTKTISSLFQQAAANPNITGSILFTDSPGGAALGTAECNLNIRSLRSVKPSVTYVDCQECSAAMWIGSGTDYTIANKNDMCMIGSIGTYMQLEDYSESAGAPKVHTIYADASTDKNADYKEAMKGNYQPLLDNIINPLNDSFLASMRKNRHGRSMKTDKVFTGKTFNAQDALTNGLIDQVGTFADAVAKIKSLSKAKTA